MAIWVATRLEYWMCTASGRRRPRRSLECSQHGSQGLAWKHWILAPYVRKKATTRGQPLGAEPLNSRPGQERSRDGWRGWPLSSNPFSDFYAGQPTPRLDHELLLPTRLTSRPHTPVAAGANPPVCAGTPLQHESCRNFTAPPSRG